MVLDLRLEDWKSGDFLLFFIGIPTKKVEPGTASTFQTRQIARYMFISTVYPGTRLATGSGRRFPSQSGGRTNRCNQVEESVRERLPHYR